MRVSVFVALAFFATAALAEEKQKPAAIQLALPTDNQGLLTGKESTFYQYVDRTENGKTTQVWQGGKYGFVRNPRNGPDGKPVYTRFHEGLDIAPTKRDAASEPLDEVRAMAAGRVVHASTDPRKSNYGIFVVVRHDSPDGPFFSLYAHLKSCAVAVDQQLKRGTKIGQMGYTGSGLDKRRAHLHVEMNLLLSERFADWHAGAFKDPNHHGIFNGLNLVGLDLATLLKEQKADPSLTLANFIKRQKPYYRVRVPNKASGDLEIVKRYPWLRTAGAAGKSWEITFTASGLPVKVAPHASACAFPVLVWSEYFSGPHAWNTKSFLAGSGNSASLTPEGVRYVNLLTGDFTKPAPKQPAPEAAKKS